MKRQNHEASQRVGDRAGIGKRDDAGGFYARLTARIGRYRTVVRWFWHDAFRRFSGRAVAVLLFSILSIGCLLGALGTIFLYIRALEAGGVIEYLGHSLIPRQSMSLLIIVAIIALCLFALSFGFRFAGKLQALALGRNYEEFCSKRAIMLLANHGGHPDARIWAEKPAQALQGDPRFCGRVARITVGIVQPVLSFVGTFGLLLVLDFGLTLIILALMVSALPILYAINVRGARHSMAMERYAKLAHKVKRDLVAGSARRGGLMEPNSPEIEKAFATGPVARHLDAYVGRLRASDNSEFLTNVLMGIGLAVILAVKGTHLLASGQGWSELATYIVALRFNLQSTTQASKILTSINRFYPQVARHFRFVQSMKELPAAPAAIDLPSDATSLDEDWDE